MREWNGGLRRARTFANEQDLVVGFKGDGWVGVLLLSVYLRLGYSVLIVDVLLPVLRSLLW